MRKFGSKTGRVWHAKSRHDWRTDGVGGTWKTGCSKDLPEVSQEVIDKRRMAPCRVCFGGKPPTE